MLDKVKKNKEQEELVEKARAKLVELSKEYFATKDGEEKRVIFSEIFEGTNFYFKEEFGIDKALVPEAWGWQLESRIEQVFFGIRDRKRVLTQDDTVSGISKILEV